MQKEPILVTVLMPVYNGQDFLKEAIESILNQTYVHLEVLIINDGSVDDSEEIILSYTDDRIVYIKNDENRGLICTLNDGMSLSKGKYIARMDADDISILDRIQKQLDFLEMNPNCGLLGSAFTIFGDKHELVKYPRENEDLKFAALFYNPFCHPSVMIRKKVFDDNKLHFKKEYIHAEEYKLWSELLLLTECYNLEDNLLMYRFHASQVSQVHRQIQLQKSSLIQNEYLKNAGFRFTAQEFESVFSDEKECKFCSSEMLLLRLKSLEKIVQQNEQIRFFNGNKFKQTFSDLYKNSVMEFPTMNRAIYSHVKSSALSKDIQWTVKQRIALVVKLFLK
jgi:glycosyltransferase involved in cell wall biosynthesis